MGRGQITIFIVLGILLLAIFAILQYSGWINLLDSGQRQFEAVVIDPETQPVFDYVKTCVQNVGQDALTRLGMHGGYVNFDGNTRSGDPTNSDGVELIPGSKEYVAYWYYLSNANTCEGNCLFRSKRPTLRGPAPSIETDLANHLRKNIKECLADFQPLKGMAFTVNERAQPTTAVTITEDSVIFLLTYPINIERGGKTYSIDRFPVEINAPLGSIYELASTITELEANNTFLEKHLRQLIDIYSGPGEESLPSTSDITFEFGSGTIWTQQSVAGRIKGLLSTYVPMLQIFGTSNYRPITAPEGTSDPAFFDKVYNRNMLIVGSINKTYPNIEARFSYLDWWNPYINIDGCEGGVCRPESLVNTIIPGVPYGMQRSRFTYDVSYPTILTLRDPLAMDGKGFTFRVALEGNLRNNEPMPRTYNPIHAIESQRTLLCEPHMATSKNLTFRVYDSLGGRLVDDAEIIYTCGIEEDEESCPVGKTSNGTLITRLPKCVGGVLSAQKAGYQTSYKQLDSDIATGAVALQIQPLNTYNFTLKRYKMEKQNDGWTLQTTPSALSNQEEAMIALTRKSSLGEEGFSAVAYLHGDSELDQTYGGHTDVQLIPGKYDVSITTMLRPYSPIIFPQKEICVGPLCKEVPDHEIQFNNTDALPIGGADYEWTARPQDLQYAKTIEFYTIDYDIENTDEDTLAIEDIGLAGNKEQNSKAYLSLLTPQTR